jgi:hypothetical protein
MMRPDTCLDQQNDVEATVTSYGDDLDHANADVPFERRPTLPPAYENSDLSSVISLDRLNSAAAYKHIGDASMPKAERHSDHVIPSDDDHVEPH